MARLSLAISTLQAASRLVDKVSVCVVISGFAWQICWCPAQDEEGSDQELPDASEDDDEGGSNGQLSPHSSEPSAKRRRRSPATARAERLRAAGRQPSDSYGAGSPRATSIEADEAGMLLLCCKPAEILPSA